MDISRKENMCSANYSYSMSNNALTRLKPQSAYINTRNLLEGKWRLLSQVKTI